MLLPSISRQNLTHFTPSAMAVFYCLSNAGNTQGSHFWLLPRDTRIARFLLEQLMAALRTKVPDLLAMGPLPCLLLLGLPCQMNTFPE